MTRIAPKLTTQPEALPLAIRELVRVLGEADAMRLIGSMPGSCVSVPKRERARVDHPLRMALSADGFDKLVGEWGGGTLDVPKGDAYLRALRHEHVRQCRAQGLTFDETAGITGYSRRHAINIMGGDACTRDTKTRDLFEEMELPTERQPTPHDPFGLAGPDVLKSRSD